MPRIGRTKDPTNAVGHCWPPCPGVPQPKANTVFVNGLHNVLVVGDTYTPHAGLCGLVPPLPPAHPEVTKTITGSPTVFANGLAVVRDADPLNCGDVVNSNAGNVFVDGGGLGGPESINDPDQTTGYSVKIPVIIYPPLNIPYVSRMMDVRANNSSPLRQIEVFDNGCPFSIKPTGSYTPLIENGSNTEYRNYPGPPIADTPVGANLPSYAPNFYKNPIRITNFTLSAYIGNNKQATASQIRDYAINAGINIIEGIANVVIPGISFIPGVRNFFNRGKRRRKSIEFKEVTTGIIMAGINFNYDTGEIYGQLDSAPTDSVYLKIQGKNYIGQSTIVDLGFNFVKKQSCQ